MKKTFILLLLFTGAIITYATFKKPHEFSRDECKLCHMDYEKEPKNLTAPVTDMCRKCHKEITLKSAHPVDTYPVATIIPPDLPLRSGTISCSTCHDIHGDAVNIFGEKTYFLRRTYTGKDFCLSCHKQGISLEPHMDVIDVAHMGSRFKVINPSEPLDPISRECISCHAGIVGRGVAFNLGSGVWTHEEPAISHPIGVDYEKSRLQRIEARLKPISLVDKRIKFFDGKIGCGTCHDVYSKDQRSLVMSNRGSKLCTSCHEL